MRLRNVAPALAAMLFAGCIGGRQPSQPSPAAQASSALRFTEIAAEAGITFRLGHGGKSPLSVLETAPGGCGWADWDGDGLSDAVLVGPDQIRVFQALPGGRFRDATAQSGISQPGEWMGCAIGDYDGDGDPDLFVTGYRCSAFYRNEGNFKFREVSRETGVAPRFWSTSAAFADVDGDGMLDLYVCGFLKYTKGRQDHCPMGAMPTACGPEQYDPEIGRLYRNQGNGRFQEATKAFGLESATGKSWSALFSDLNRDGKPDLYLANDQEPCDLFLNRGSKFHDAGAELGVAYDAAGNVMGAMGLEAGDIDGNGFQDLLVTTYYQQARGLFLNGGKEGFRNRAEEWGLDLPARHYVGFGCCLFDADCDGDLDLFMTNGHVRDNIHQFDSGQQYGQPMQLFENREGAFVDVSDSAGAAFSAPIVGRGAATADYDRDGDLDLLVVDLEGSARLLRNDTPRAGNRWLKVKLSAPQGNREAIGAVVEMKLPNRTLVREVYRCRSVLSASDAGVHFGLGTEQPVSLTVRWPGGVTQRLAPPSPEKEVEAILGS